jgi:hypothetical protein
LNHLAPAGDQTAGTFPLKASFNWNQEFAMQTFAMQTFVDKVIHAFSFKHSDDDDEDQRAQREATELAAELLENYKSQLARQTLRAQRR